MRIGRINRYVSLIPREAIRESGSTYRGTNQCLFVRVHSGPLFNGPPRSNGAPRDLSVPLMYLLLRDNLSLRV